MSRTRQSDRERAAAALLFNRRSLLLGGCTALAAALGSNLQISGTARANPAAGRRHFINIHSYGGADTMWSWSPVRESDAIGVADKASQFYGYAAGKVGVGYTADTADTPAANAVRFADEHLIAHDGKWLGPLCSMFSPEDLAAMAVVRGVKPEGSHFVGNRLIQNGHFSPYAISLALLIADHLGKSQSVPKALHYVQCVASPEDIYTQTVNYKGPFSPVAIPASTDWEALTGNRASDPLATGALRSAFNAALADLSMATARANRDEIKRRFEVEFKRSTESAAMLFGSDLAQSPEFGFPQLVASYVNEAKEQFRALYAASAPVRSSLRPNLGANPTAAQLDGFVGPRANGYAFQYALAEFLVRNDLSAVVEIMAPTNDYHTDNIGDLRDSIVSLSFLRLLMRNLRAAPLEGVPGGRLLDVTTVSLSTEFDRTVARGLENPGSNNPGAGHGETATFVLAGAGIVRGRMFGMRSTGPAGILSAPGFPKSLGLPITFDAAGQPSPSGHNYVHRSLLPTLMKAFGANMPLQQVTEAHAMDFLLARPS